MLASPEKRIQEIEEEIRRTPYNKATQKHVGRLRAKLARLREEAARPKGARQEGPGIRKAGDATVALTGYPSVGKSTLLNVITEAASQVGEYDFTTLQAVPGILAHRGAKIQLLDLPGLTKGAASGWGRGREVLSQVRIADLLLLMVDVERPDPRPLLTELQAAGIRVNEAPPKVLVRRRIRGGLAISVPTKQTELDEDLIREVVREWGIINAEVVVREDLTLERLNDHLAGNRVYVPGLVVLNKVDLMGDDDMARLARRLQDGTLVPISAKEGRGLEDLIETVYRRLSFIRVYLRPPGRRDDSSEPLILKEGARVADACKLVHRDFVDRFRHARVWGPSVRFPGQKVGLNHTLKDGDTLTIASRGG